MVAVDVSELKVAAINSGLAPILEPRLAELIAEGVAERRLRATIDIAQAVATPTFRSPASRRSSSSSGR